MFIAVQGQFDVSLLWCQKFDREGEGRVVWMALMRIRVGWDVRDARDRLGLEFGSGADIGILRYRLVVMALSRLTRATLVFVDRTIGL